MNCACPLAGSRPPGDVTNFIDVYGLNHDQGAGPALLDRTPWYAMLSRLEKQLRAEIGYYAKNKNDHRPDDPRGAPGF